MNGSKIFEKREMESTKWSRNLSANKSSELNRIRQITKQKMESKRTRNQTPMVTSTRQQSARTIRPAISRKPDLGESSEFSIDNSTNTINEDSMKGQLIDQLKDTLKTHKTDQAIDKQEVERPASVQSSQTKLASVSQTHSAEEDNLEELSEDERLIENRTKDKRMEKSKSTFNLSSVANENRLLKAFESNISTTIVTSNLSRDLNPLKSLLNNSELLEFVVNPVSRNKVYQCTIIRDKKGIDRSLYPTYYMHLQTINSKDDNQQLKVEDFKETTTITATKRDENGLLDNGSRTSVANGSLVKNGSAKSSNSNQNSQTNHETNEAQNRQVFLLSGRRRKKSKTYLISCNPFEITRTNSIAKLKSNVIGTQFNTIRILQDNHRLDYATIIYDTNVLGFKGPRKMTVILPKTEANNQKKLSLNSEIALADLNKMDPKSVIKLKNKTPVWNEETQSYVLNFKGRVTQASVKNFQLEICDLNEELENRSKEDFAENYSQSTEQSPSNSSNKIKNTFMSNDFISMQFGRISNSTFTCDVSWPLSLLQAFSIALSSFDSKLACE